MIKFWTLAHSACDQILLCASLCRLRTYQQCSGAGAARRRSFWPDPGTGICKFRLWLRAPAKISFRKNSAEFRVSLRSQFCSSEQREQNGTKRNSAKFWSFTKQLTKVVFFECFCSQKWFCTDFRVFSVPKIGSKQNSEVISFFSEVVWNRILRFFLFRK